jgi:hypothetical protein
MERNKILFFMLLLLIATTSNVLAWEITARGLKGGVNFATLSGPDSEFYDFGPQRLTTFSVGGFLIYTKDDMINIQPEVYYCRKGVKYDEYDVEITFKLDYIDIPVLGTYKLAENIRAFAGPSLGIYLGSNYEVLEDGDLVESGDLNDYAVMSGIDLGLVLGGSYTINKIILDARYSFSLTTVVQEWKEEEDTTVSVKNNLIQLLVGYKF